MALDKKKGMIVLTSLLFGTFGVHAVYRAHAKDRAGAPTATAPLPANLGLRGVLRDLRTEAHPATPIHVEAGDGGVLLTATVDRTKVLQKGDGLLHVEVSVKTKAHPDGVTRAPTDVIVVLDHSGSMSGTKLDYAKQALLGLIDRLGPQDRLGVVTFASDAHVLIPLGTRARSSWRTEVQELETAGGTNIGSGLDLALGMIAESRGERPTRVLLLSDGQDNEGAAAFPGLVRRARDVGSKRAVLSTLGIGQDFDENVMTSLATVGTGAFYYLAKLEVLPQMLDAELKTATETYARTAALHVRLADGMKVVSAGAIPLETRGSEVVVPLGSLYAGRERKLWLTVQVPTNAALERALGELAVRYERTEKTFEVKSGALPRIACVSDDETFKTGLVPDVWKRAMLEEELTRAREELGDAIARGTAQDVETSVGRVEQQRVIAEMLGQTDVVREITELKARGEQAKLAQQSAPDVRNLAAKREKATGYGRRNASQYSSSGSWESGF